VSSLWDVMRGAMATKALGAAADLRIAEELAAGPRPVGDLAQATGADPDTLYRILRALASEGVFAEDESGVRRFGTDFWSWLEATPDERAAFDAAMSGGKDRPADRLAELDWRDGEVVVDVGGGNGALLRALLQRRPELRGIVFDLPETVRNEDALGERIEFVAGSLADSAPPGDAYVLSGILHDWNDERAAAILRTIRTAAPPHARLLVLESVLQPGNEPHGAKWLDLLMLVLGGRERTEPEWQALLGDTGFEITSTEDGLVQAACR
jgi:hypothetical protein